MKKIADWISGHDPVKFFLPIALVFGLTFIVITPPFQGPDEITHFLRAYQVSDFNFVSDKYRNETGGSLPKSLGDTIDVVSPNEVTFYPAIKYDGGKTKTAILMSQDNNERFYDFPGSASYSPMAYVGAAPGIFVSRVLDLPALVALFAGRLGNLFLWVAIVAIAIATIPYRKWIVVFIGLLPMALFQASTIGGDVVTTGSVLLLVALILRARERNKITTRDIIALAALATAMVLSKQIMFIFLPLVFLIKKTAFKTYKENLLTKTTLIVIPLVVYVLWALISHSVTNTGVGVPGQDASEQLKFIISNPHSFINVIWNTFFYTWSDGVTRSLIGTFGWADTPLSEGIVSLGYIGGALISLGMYTSGKQFRLRKSEKLLVGVVAIFYFLAVSVALYIYYSPVGYKIIYGLQGRYFIPLLVLLLPLFATQKIRIEKSTYIKLAKLVPFLLLISSSITIYVRYYINNV